MNPDDSDLLKAKCQPCEGIGRALNEEEWQPYLDQIEGWTVTDGKLIEKEYESRNFVSTMAFANKIAELAEQEDHHPDLHLYYRKVHVVLTTHALGGLTENDFILAAKIDHLESAGQATD
jgi:4a-hydroxytetrahydrobiopterin dehydratase